MKNREIDPKTGRLIPTHGQSYGRLYRIWNGMKYRGKGKYVKDCYKGIGYCSEWEQFVPFQEWSIANGYADNLTIDRLDATKDYSPENCQWITCTENNRRRKGIKLTMEKAMDIRQMIAGGAMQKEASEKYGIAQGTVSGIISGKRWKDE